MSRKSEHDIYPERLSLDVDPSGKVGIITPSESVGKPNVVSKRKDIMVIVPQVGPKPTSVKCPSCGISTKTRIEYTANTKTYFMSGCLCILGLCCLVCLPCCMKSCRNANHYCKNCGSFIGTYPN